MCLSGVKTTAFLLLISNPLVQAHLLKQQTTKVVHPVLQQSPVDMVMSLDPSAAPEVSPEEARGSRTAEALPNGGSQADNLRQRLRAREAACEGMQEQLAATEAQLESLQVTAGFAVVRASLQGPRNRAVSFKGSHYSCKL